MTTTDAAGLLVALAAPGDQNVSLWMQLMPFVFVLGIFYFIILLPMKRRQKKVQQFLDALKVGDRVVTTGGLYGEVIDLKDRSVRLQISDNPKVRIEVSKAAIGGYQGQEPVAPENPQ